MTMHSYSLGTPHKKTYMHNNDIKVTHKRVRNRVENANAEILSKGIQVYKAYSHA